MEKRGLLNALFSVLITAVICSILCLPRDWVGPLAVFRDEKGTLDPLVHSIVFLIALGFLIPGVVVRSIRSDDDVARMTGETMATMGPYIVLAFAMAQFVNYFGWSNLGLMLALGGAAFLKSLGLGPVPLLIGIILLTAFLNLFIGSASAKWAVLASIFVPMFMSVGLSPELAQATYRVGDSVTNMITPLMLYFAMVIAYCQRYVPDMKIGSLISAMLPFSVTFLIFWTVMLVVWFLVGAPLGPEGTVVVSVG